MAVSPVIAPSAESASRTRAATSSGAPPSPRASPAASRRDDCRGGQGLAVPLEDEQLAVRLDEPEASRDRGAERVDPCAGDGGDEEPWTGRRRRGRGRRGREIFFERKYGPRRRGSRSRRSTGAAVRGRLGRRRNEIGFRHHEQHPLPSSPSKKIFVLFGHSRTRIHDVKDEVRLLPRPRRDRDADLLDLVLASSGAPRCRGASPSRRRSRTASEIASRVVPGTAVTMARSRPTRALKSVDFPAFGRPRIATTLRRSRAPPRAAAAPRASASAATASRASAVARISGARTSSAKSNDGLEPGKHVERSLARRRHAPRQLSLHERKRPPRRAPALRPRERGEALGLGEIQLAVREGAPRELAPRRRPRPRRPRGREEPRHDRGRPVAEELHDLLARGRVRRRKEDHEGAVQRPAILPDEAVQRRLARARLVRKARRNPTGDRKRQAGRTREPDDRQRRDARRRRRGDDDVGSAVRVGHEARHGLTSAPRSVRTPSASSRPGRGR